MIDPFGIRASEPVRGASSRTTFESRWDREVVKLGTCAAPDSG